MDHQSYQEKIEKLDVGKRLADAVYLHRSAFDASEELFRFATKISNALKIKDIDWNVLKLFRKDFKISFLLYPDFEIVPFPLLSSSYSVDLRKLTLRKMDYKSSSNPPILHRKELLLSQSHPRIGEYLSMTERAEALGLFENTRKIGTKSGWDFAIKRAGYRLSPEGEFVELPVSEKLPADTDGEVTVERYRTALQRHELSQPIQALAKSGFLDGDYSVLDYGCGRGDDVTELSEHGLEVSGWDPNFYPDGELLNSDIVNLGFVLNVIEDKDERDETLKKAWGFADKLLIVSIMIANDEYISRFTPYRDGVITKRKTFQKYYTQAEFREYLERTLDESAVAVAQGIFIVFKDKDEEQKYLLEKQFNSRNWISKTYSTKNPNRKLLREAVYNSNKELFDSYWEKILSLGRVPLTDEYDNHKEIAELCGSQSKALKFLSDFYDPELLQLAKGLKREDLIVYFALGLFEKRRAYSRMPASLKADIKAFFGSYKAAQEEAKVHLFSVGDPVVIKSSCKETYEYLGCGEFNEDNDYIFLQDYLGEAPTFIRIYIGCAIRLFGEIEGYQLIKVHFHSGKVTFLKYAEWDTDKPHLAQRVKCRLRDLEVDIFDYNDEYGTQYLENKPIFFKN